MSPLHCSSYVVVHVVMQPWPLHKTCRLKTSLHYYFIGISLEVDEAFSDCIPSAKHSNSLSQPIPAIMS